MNDEQRKCAEHGSHGHNFMIYGEAGTGKSLTVMELTKELQKSGKTLQTFVQLELHVMCIKTTKQS